MKAASRINSADNHHEKLWKAFCDLARTVRRRRADDLPGGFAGALREVGWDPHGISATTVGKHLQDCCFTLDGDVCRLTSRSSSPAASGSTGTWTRATVGW